MSMNAPSQINVPLSEDYPFIDIEVERVRRESDRSSNDPGMLTDEMVSCFTGMSNKTFMTMCSIMSPTSWLTRLRSKEQLEEIANHELSQLTAISSNEFCYPDEGECPFTKDQFIASIAYGTSFDKNPSWGRLAKLYNESKPDQQEALYGFFLFSMNIHLGEIVMHKRKDIEIPNDLKPTNTRVDISGESFIENGGKWLRADLFLRKFEVKVKTIETVYSNEDNGDYLLNVLRTVAFSGTLEEAIAKSIVYSTTPGEYKRIPDEIIIQMDGRNVCCAKVYFDPSVGNSIVVDWSTDHLALNIEHEKSRIDELERDASEASRGDSYFTASTYRAQADKIREKISMHDNPVVPHKIVTDAIFMVEQAFGLSWSKVKHLEEGLGL